MKSRELRKRRVISEGQSPEGLACHVKGWGFCPVGSRESLKGFSIFSLQFTLAIVYIQRGKD